MATAKKLPSGTWRVRVYTHTSADGKKHYKSFTADTKRKAESQATHYLETYGNKSSTDMTVGEAIDAYIALREPVLSPSTVPMYRSIRKHKLQGIMDVNIDDLTNEAVQKEINAEYRSGSSPKTCRNIHGLLSAALGEYRPDFVLRTKLPEKVKANLYIPTDEDVKILMKAVKDTDMELPILLAAFGPMRRGEICALNTSNISGRIVHVCENMVRNIDLEWVIKAPKSYAGDRFIEFPDFVAKKWRGKKGRVVQLNPAMVTGRFTKLLQACNLPHFRFHDLRHYSASIQHAMGIPDAYIMQRAGWSSDGVLKTVYRHALDDKQREMAKLANDYFTRMTQV